MKAVVQRAKGKSSLKSTWLQQSGESQSEIDEHSGPALIVLLGWEKGDSDDLAGLTQKENWIRSRILGLRIFPDDQGKTNLDLSNYCESTREMGAIFWVPQFTLAGKLDSGFRPSFSGALDPQVSRERFKNFCQQTRDTQPRNVKHFFGVFGADMEVTFCNWGPFTLIL